MRDYKLSKLVRGLTPKEEKTLYRSLLNDEKEKETAHLLALCYYNERYDAGFDKLTAFGKIFEEEKIYDDEKMRKLMLRLSQYIERFLIQQALEDDPALRQRLLVRALAQRSSYELFSQAVEQAKTGWEEQPGKGVAYYEAMAELNKALYKHPETHKYKAQLAPFHDMIQHLEGYFTLASLEFGAESLLRQRILRESPPASHFLKTALEIVPKMDAEAHPEIHFFRKVIEMYQPGAKEEVLFELVDEYKTEEQSMAQYERKLALELLIQLVLMYSNKGNKKASTKEYELYCTGLESQLLLEAGKLTANRFNNIVMAGISEQEFDWVTTFIQQYQTRIIPKNEEHNAVHLAKAYLYYFKALSYGNDSKNQDKKQQNFDQCEKVLVPLTRGKNLFNVLRARGLYLRYWYDRAWSQHHDVEELIDKVKAFETFLHRKKELADSRRKSYLYFSAFLRKLILLRNDPNTKPNDYLELQREVEESKNLILGNWLLEKIKERY